MSKKKHVADEQKTPLFYYLALIIPAILYARTSGFGFVFHDDDTMILSGAAALQKFDFNNIFFTDAWLSKATIELYRPWQSFTYFIDYSFGQTDPKIFHIHNIIIYIAAIALVYPFLRLLRFSAEFGALLTLFYACNSLFAHDVSWIPARGDLYLSFFGLSSLLVLGRHQQTGRWFPWLPLYLFCFCMALLSKESGVSILPLSLLLMVFLKGTSSLRKPAAWLPLLLALPLLAVYLWMRKQSVAHTNDVNLNALLYNMPTIPESILKFYLPAEFSVMPMFKSWKTLGGIVLILMLGVLIFRSLKKDESGRIRSLLPMALGLFLLPLLPSLAYKPLFAGFAYDYLDHRMFFIGLGLLLLLGIMLETVSFSNNRNKSLFFLLFIGIHGFAAAWNTQHYKGFHEYYNNAIETNPRSGLALLNYSGLLRQQDKNPEQALSTINKAIALYPDSAIFYIEKVNDLFLLNRCDSLETLLPILKRDGRYAGDAWIYEGICASQRGQNELAVRAFLMARKLNPAKAEACFNIARFKRIQNDFTGAVAYLDTAISLNPAYAQAYSERGNLYGNLGRFDLALRDYQLYVQMRPDDPNGIFYRGQAYCLTGQKQLGCADLFRADQLGVAEAKDKIARFCR